MKSLRTITALSLIAANILIILLISTSMIVGIFQLNTRWAETIATDITASINHTITLQYPDLTDITDLNKEQFEQISDDALEEHKGRLRDVSYFSNAGVLLYHYNIADALDNPTDRPFNFELMRWTAEIKHSLANDDPQQHSNITGRNEQAIGTLGIHTYPLMGIRYGTFFDQIITRFLLLGIFLAVFVSLAISFIISKRLSINSRILAQQLSKLAAGERDINFNRGLTLETQSSAEAAEQLQSQLKHNEMAQLRKLRDIIHDLKTPVAALGIQFEAVRDGVLKIDDERVELLGSEFSRIEEIIGELSHYTKLSSEDYVPNSQRFDLNELMLEIEERFKLLTQQKNQEIILKDPEQPAIIETDRLGIMRVFNNLTANAMNNAPENSSIRISVNHRKRIIDEAELLSIEFENDGRIDVNDLPLIFDRLYRSKQSGYEGNGLGLAISKAIVERNHGEITAVNTAFNTVIFRVELPLSSPTT